MAKKEEKVKELKSKKDLEPKKELDPIWVDPDDFDDYGDYLIAKRKVAEKAKE